MVEDLLRDIRFGLRALARSPGFSALAVVTLGLGIGANAAIFSVINGVLLKPLPYASGDRLLLIRQSAARAGRPNVGVAIKELYDYREHTRSFDGIVEYHQMNFDLLKRGEPDRVSTGVVSHDFFDVLGIAPILGRSFRSADDAPGADAVLILSYSYWQSRFGGDPAIVGQVFEMNDRPHTVVGVLPNVPHYPQENDVYMPVSACPFRAAAERTIPQNRRAFSALTVFGRLAPGVSHERAASDVAAIGDRFTHENPGVYRPAGGFAASTVPVRDQLTRSARPMLLILMGTTALVLLIACGNVANLTLARLLRRDRELAVRTALGASRGHLVRQLLTESTLLALAGGGLGVLLAASTRTMLASFVGRFTTRTGEITIDPWVLAFTLLLSMVTGLAFGTFPALSARVDLSSAMKQGGRGSSAGRGRVTAQNLLIVAQVAVSVVLLVGAGLLLVSFYRLQTIDPGYRGDRVLAAEAFPNFSKYATAESQIQFYETALARLQSEAGIQSAAVTNAVPLSGSQPGPTPFQIEGQVPEDLEKRPTADVRVVSPSYFETLGVPLFAGRAFTTQDRREGAAVAIVNQAMMRHFAPRDPIASRLSFDGGRTWITVVGVVGNVRQFGLAEPSIAQMYIPLAQSQGLAGRLLLRTAAAPATAGRIVRDAVHAIDPNMPVENVRTLDDLRDTYLATPRLTATLLSIFAALALVVTMAGVTGVIATSVSHRMAEFGVRMALGASRDRLLGQVIVQGLTLVVSGLAIGTLASVLLTRILSAYLFETTSRDPVTLVSVAALFLIAGVLACVGPAWRATTANPLVALRTE